MGQELTQVPEVAKPAVQRVQLVAEPTQVEHVESQATKSSERDDSEKSGSYLDTFRSRWRFQWEHRNHRYTSRRICPLGEGIHPGMNCKCCCRTPRQRKMTVSCKPNIQQDKLRAAQQPDNRLKAGNDPQSHFEFPLFTTNTPCIPLKDESHTPVDASNPTQSPFKLTRGDAQARQSDVDGPVQVLHAGEQLFDRQPNAYVAMHQDMWRLTPGRKYCFDPSTIHRRNYHSSPRR